MTTDNKYYTVYPNVQGQAVGKHQWDHVLDWVKEHEPHAHTLALAWHVDAEELEQYYDADLKADRFYDKVSDKVCDCCGEEIAGGKSFYLMTYSDGSTQSPLCYKCATEAMEGEVIEATNDAGNVALAKVISDKMKDAGLNVRHWSILAWMIAQKAVSRDLVQYLEQNGVNETLRQCMVFNQPIGATQ